MPKPATTLLTLALLLTPAHAADPAVPPEWPVKEFNALLQTPAPTPEARAQTARLIKDLTSPDFATREAASKELATKGPAAFPGLREAVAASADPELSTRVMPYLSDDAFQVPPNAPPKTTQMINDYKRSRAEFLEVVSRMPDWDGPFLLNFDKGISGGYTEMFFKLILAQEVNPKVRAVLERELQSRWRDKSRQAIAAGQLDEAELILLAMGDNPDARQDYVALRALRQGEALDPEKEISKLSLQDSAKEQMLMLMFRAKGDFAHAANYARPDSDSWSSWSTVLIEAGRYAEFAKSLESFPARGDWNVDHATAYQLIGNPKRADEIVNAAVEKYRKGEFRGNLFSLLLIHDRADQAIELALQRGEQQELVFQLLCARLQIREALASIKDRQGVAMELPEQLTDLGLASAARSLLKDMRPNTLERYSYNYAARSDFYYAGELAIAGQPEEFAKWRDRGFNFVEPYAKEQIDLQRQLAAAKVGLAKTDRTKDPIGWEKYQSAMLKIGPELTVLGIIVDAMTFHGCPLLPDFTSQMEASFWYEDVLRNEPLEVRARYDRAVRVVLGKLSDDEFSKTIDDVVAFGAGRIYRQLPSVQKRFHDTGHDAATLELVNRLVKAYGDPVFWVLMGDQALESNQPAQAVNYYQQAAVLNLSDATLMYRLGLALQRSHQNDVAGRQLMEYAPLLVLGDLEGATSLAGTIRRFEGEAAADAWFGPFTRRYSRTTQYNYGNSIVGARDAAEARGDVVEALDFQKKLLFSSPSPLDRRYIVPVNFMSNIAHYHRLRALDALSRKDFPTLENALNGTLNNGPPDPDFLEKTLPALRSANPAAAQNILSRALDRLTPIVQDYPEATQYQTQLTRLQALAK